MARLAAALLLPALAAEVGLTSALRELPHMEEAVQVLVQPPPHHPR